MRKIITMGTILVSLGLIWSGRAAVGGAGVASAAPPLPADDQYGGSMPYYPTGSYGGATTHPMSSYRTVMPVQAGSTSGLTATVTTPGVTVTSPYAASYTTTTSQQGSSAVRIANFAFNPPAATIMAGQTVTWMNAAMVAHTTTSDNGVWNSGPLQPGASFSQTFPSAGTFTYHCMIHPFMMGSITVQSSTSNSYGGSRTTSSYSPSTTTAPYAQAGGLSVTYAAGWDLVAGPTGTIVTGNVGPLYTFRAGDTSYEVVPAGTPLAAGTGYWAYFTAPMTEALSSTAAQPTSMQLPAGRFIMVGNSSATPVAVAGADAVFTYDTARGYQQVTALQAGQGAWAFSTNGGTLTIAPAPSAAGPAAAAE